jgi:arabinose-5-phosphate isomerase
MGDAVAVALIKARDFKPMDFARFHPGGSLGRRLLTRVRDVMHRDNLPFVGSRIKVRDCIFTMTACRLGLALVVEEGLLEGIITDGDLRRVLLQDPDMMDTPVSEFMDPDPVTSLANRMLTEAEAVGRENKIRALVVLGERGQPGVQDDICGLLECID